MYETLVAILEAMPYLLQGAMVTIAIVLGAMGFGLIIGLHMAVGQVYGNRSVRWMVGIYVWFFRGVPILVLLFLFYFGLCTIFIRFSVRKWDSRKWIVKFMLQ